MEKYFKNKKVLIVIIFVVLFWACLLIGVIRKNNSNHAKQNVNDSSEIGLTVQDEIDNEMEEENTIIAPDDWGDEKSEETKSDEENNNLNSQVIGESEKGISETNEDVELEAGEDDKPNLEEDENNMGGYGALF